MHGTWMVAVAMAAAMEGQTVNPQADALVTVFTYNGIGVPTAVMARAERVATAAFATAGVEVRWVAGKRLREPLAAITGGMLTVVLDREAPVNARPGEIARTNLGEGADADVHVFYDRVTRFADRLYMPEFLGNVLAHELTHALERVMRHSSEGLMKAAWSVRDYSAMVNGPLPFAAKDVELLRDHFRWDTPQTPALVPIR